MNRHEILNMLSAASSYLNVIMSDIEKVAPIVMDYCDQKRSETTIRYKLEQSMYLIMLAMDEIEG